MFFGNWNGIFRVLVVGVLAYLALILILRIAGKRTLSKWNAFDFVVTIALGSSLATVIVSRQVVFAEGVLALLMLIALQYAITWSSVRSTALQGAIKAEPALLLTEGQFLPNIMARQRVTESEVLAAVRGSGTGSLDDVAAVVLETDGSISVVKRSACGNASALSDVAGYKGEAT